jgi:nucleotide-binding universal stress UspA family protein
LTANATSRVLIAYDGSPSAATALRAVASLFPSAHAHVVTVPDAPGYGGAEFSAGAEFPGRPMMAPDAVQEMIDVLDAEAGRQAAETAQQAVDRAGALGLRAEAEPVDPSTRAWAALLDAAHRLGADVLACGTRGRGAFARALLGSTSSRLLHQTDLPLLVVPDGGGTFDGPVVAAYDGSEGATRAIQVLGRLVDGRATVVVHAWAPIFHRSLKARALEVGPVDDVRETIADIQRWRSERAAAVTQAGVAAARAAGLDAAGDTVESDEGAWRAVAAAAQTHGASVIATGTRGLGAARSALQGSVSSGLVQNAELPILVVPEETAATALER